jgi:hypothetical protein
MTILVTAAHLMNSGQSQMTRKRMIQGKLTTLMSRIVPCTRISIFPVDSAVKQLSVSL